MRDWGNRKEEFGGVVSFPLRFNFSFLLLFSIFLGALLARFTKVKYATSLIESVNTPQKHEAPFFINFFFSDQFC